MEQSVAHGHPEDAHVEPRVPVGDVVEVVLQVFALGGVASRAAGAPRLAWGILVSFPLAGRALE